MKKEYISHLKFPKTTPFFSLNYKNIDLDKIVSSKFNNNSGVIAIHKGKVVLEKYFNNHYVSDTFHVASVTKKTLNIQQKEPI